ncbi:MAG: thioredoxin domain-containing protein [Candidatus Woesearchaeota archaeon]
MEKNQRSTKRTAHKRSERGKKSKAQKTKSKKIIVSTIIGLIVLISIIGVLFFTRISFQKGKQMQESTPQKMNIYIFGDFECPYTKRIGPVLENIIKSYGDRVNVIYKHLPLSFHPNALPAAIAAECAKSMNADIYLEYVIKLLSSPSLNPSTYVAIAKDLKLDPVQFQKCIDENLTLDNVKSDVELASYLGITGTPAFIIGDQAFASAIDFPAVARMIDDALRVFNGTNPDLRDSSIEVKGYLLYAEECSTCNNEWLILAAINSFPQVKFEILEIKDDAAKEVIKNLKIEVVPSILIHKDIEKTFFWKINGNAILQSFEKVGEWYRFKIEDSQFEYYWLDENKRKQKEEELNAIFEFEPGKVQIDFFIMSFCPYGNIAEEAISETYPLLKNYVKYVPRYIYYPRSTGNSNSCLYDNEKNIHYCALHGIKELEQDVRELCVYYEEGIEKYFEFVKGINKNCSISNIDSCWKNVASAMGLDTNKIEQCFEQNKLKYVREQTDKATKLGVSGSPTVFINGQKYLKERTPEAYKNALCNEMNPKPKECEVSLSNVQNTPTGSCG